jgi:hypothetical protein
MKQNETLQLIRARCVELLEQAKLRTPGEWTAFQRNEELNSNYWRITFTDNRSDSLHGYCGINNAAYIANASVAFEAALESTIAAIDGIIDPNSSETTHAWAIQHDAATVTRIITAWKHLLP